jgi:hypothetical protein
MQQELQWLLLLLVHLLSLHQVMVKGTAVLLLLLLLEKMAEGFPCCCRCCCWIPQRFPPHEAQAKAKCVQHLLDWGWGWG